MQALERVHTGLVMMTGWRRWTVALLAGAVTALAMAPYHLFAVCFVTFPIVVWLLDGAVRPVDAGFFRRHMPAFAIGWWFGLGYFLAGIWWIANALLVEAREFIWFIPLAVLGLPAVLAVFYGVATALARSFWSDGLARVAMLAFAFGLLEFARSWVATGFPWNAVGYALTPIPVMMQSASIIGIAGLNLIAVFVFALPACFAGPVRRVVPALTLIVIIMTSHIGYGVWRLAIADAIPADETLPIVRVVQPSIDQSVKVASIDRDAQMARLLDLTGEPSDDGVLPDLILWPETAVPYILTQSPRIVSAIAARLEPGQVLMTGAVRVEGEVSDGVDQRFYNSILVLDDEGIIIDAADKVHLVPFGEYLPFRSVLESLGMRKIVDADRGYVGAPNRNLITPRENYALLPLICYEVIFSRYARNDGKDASAIVTVSNDAWFGNTAGPHQHLHHAQLRAVETGLPLIRAANSGISTSFDAFGRPLTDSLQYGAVGATQFQMTPRLAETVYKQYGIYYSWLLLVVFALIGLFGFAYARSRP